MRYVTNDCLYSTLLGENYCRKIFSLIDFYHFWQNYTSLYQQYFYNIILLIKSLYSFFRLVSHRDQCYQSFDYSCFYEMGVCDTLTKVGNYRAKKKKKKRSFSWITRIIIWALKNICRDLHFIFEREREKRGANGAKKIKLPINDICIDDMYIEDIHIADIYYDDIYVHNIW